MFIFGVKTNPVAHGLIFFLEVTEWRERRLYSHTVSRKDLYLRVQTTFSFQNERTMSEEGKKEHKQHKANNKTNEGWFLDPPFDFHPVGMTLLLWWSFYLRVQFVTSHLFPRTPLLPGPLHGVLGTRWVDIHLTNESSS